MKEYICDVCGKSLRYNGYVTSETFPTLQRGPLSIDVMRLFVRRGPSTRYPQNKTCGGNEPIQQVKSIDICTECLQAVMDTLDNRNHNIIHPPAENPQPKPPTDTGVDPTIPDEGDEEEPNVDDGSDDNEEN